MTAIGVAHVHHSLGFGGTQKSIEYFVRHASDWLDSRVLCLDDIGVRGKALLKDGHEVRCVDNVSGVREYLCGHDIDVVHVHGGFDRGTDVVDIAQNLSVPAILKSLHFGKPSDGSSSTYVDRYLYVGKMILLRNLLLSNHSLLPQDWRDDHRLLYNPIDLTSNDPDGPKTYRKQFDIPHDAPVVGKLGRSAPEKWGKITVDALDRVAAERPDVNVILVNTPLKIQRRIRACGIENVHYVDQVPLGHIDEFYNSIDVLTHASSIGECCPYVFLEAMATGTPIVVNSQPMRDNGQIELVDHGTQGYVANTPRAYGEATLELLNDPETRAAMGTAGRKRVEKMFDASIVVDRLEDLYATVLVENGAFTERDLPWWNGPPAVTEMPAFATDYARRLQTSYDSSGARYVAETKAWNLVTSLPAGRKPAYELTRKAFMIDEMYLR
jgi:glycosyltransferase involved in cell wall biosynthesis